MLTLLIYAELYSICNSDFQKQRLLYNAPAGDGTPKFCLQGMMA